MSTEQVVAAVVEPADEQAANDAAPAPNQWVETAMTVMFAAVAVLFVSFVAVVTGLV